MNIFEILSGLTSQKKSLKLESLPSIGLFYADDFKIWIKKATADDIERYEKNYKKNDIGVIITQVKNIVKSNTIFSDGWKFEDLKSVDIIFIFLEIVKFTTKKEIIIKYTEEGSEVERSIEFSSENFNYFDLPEELKPYYDKTEKQFIIDGWKFSLPTIGVENCLTIFLIDKNGKKNSKKYNEYTYDFTYFLGDKNFISGEEIENLIQIFNFDLEDEDKEIVKNIVDIFSPLQKYSLKRLDKVIDISSKIDLEKIWK